VDDDSLIAVLHRNPDIVRIVDADRQRHARQWHGTTRYEWGKWLDRIGGYFGELQIRQFDRPEKIRPIILKWRNRWAETPRTADYGMQVRVLGHAVEIGRLGGNPCEGVKHLYSNDRADIIWIDADVALIKQTCSNEIAHAVDLAGHTGLRLGDLLRVAWSHVDEGLDAIVLTTGKSRQRREAIIPLYPALRNVLARIPRRATTILTNSRHRPWTVDGFGSSFNKAKIDAGMADRDLHFNDLRGTAATKFYIADLSERVIAEILGWEEDSVKKIIRRYVERGAAIKATIEKLKAKQ
jgi:integrase